MYNTRSSATKPKLQFQAEETAKQKSEKFNTFLQNKVDVELNDILHTPNVIERSTSESSLDKSEKIGIKVTVRNINDVDTQKQTFFADVWVMYAMLQPVFTLINSHIYKYMYLI